MASVAILIDLRAPRVFDQAHVRKLVSAGAKTGRRLERPVLIKSFDRPVVRFHEIAVGHLVIFLLLEQLLDRTLGGRELGLARHFERPVDLLVGAHER